MNPLLFLAPYKVIIEAIAIGALIIGIGLGVHHFLQAEQKIGYDKAVAEYSVKLAEAKADALAKERQFNKQIQEAQNAATVREQTLKTVAAAASASSLSLRDTIAHIRSGVPTATLDALRVSTTALSTVFADCQDRYRAMAATADATASDTKKLIDAWPK